jgi:hypothetical protein
VRKGIKKPRSFFERKMFRKIDEFQKQGIHGRLTLSKHIGFVLF